MLQTELKLLKSQINPHFLFNALNNIYALSVIDSNQTQQSISYLSNMLRYVLYECEEKLVPLKKEIDYINDFIKLYSLKSSKPYNITTQYTIADNNLLVAPMLFIPFVENAFKHGHIEKHGNSFISIIVNATSSLIELEIENSQPKNAINKDAVGGIGIENVKKRLSILYPEKHQLSILESSETFKIKLNLEVSEKS
jgi:two-component system LytT family sensor kinase